MLEKVEPHRPGGGLIQGTKGQPGPALTCPNPLAQVILGGGRKYMFPKGTPDPEYPADATQSGVRLDGRHLVQEWQAKHQVMGARGGGGRAGRGQGCWSRAVG